MHAMLQCTTCVYFIHPLCYKYIFTNTLVFALCFVQKRFNHRAIRRSLVKGHVKHIIFIAWLIYNQCFRASRNQAGWLNRMYGKDDKGTRVVLTDITLCVCMIIMSLGYMVTWLQL